jgi:hypothetical protein
MKLLLVFVLFFSFTTSFSQQEDIFKRKPWENIEKKYKFEIQKKANENKMVQNNQNDPSMPVLKPKLTARYLGSNGKGADVYAMMPYKMPCLVPDSTFVSKMPIALKDNSKTPTVMFIH